MISAEESIGDVFAISKFVDKSFRLYNRILGQTEGAHAQNLSIKEAAIRQAFNKIDFFESEDRNLLFFHKKYCINFVVIRERDDVYVDKASYFNGNEWISNPLAYYYKNLEFKLTNFENLLNEIISGLRASGALSEDFYTVVTEMAAASGRAPDAVVVDILNRWAAASKANLVSRDRVAPEKSSLKQVRVNLPQSIDARLQIHAAELGVSVNEVIKRAVHFWYLGDFAIEPSVALAADVRPGPTTRPNSKTYRPVVYEAAYDQLKETGDAEDIGGISAAARLAVAAYLSKYGPTEPSPGGP